nr:MAG TPA: hypothetical protein [Caudoviricetes sp.]
MLNPFTFCVHFRAYFGVYFVKSLYFLEPFY